MTKTSTTPDLVIRRTFNAPRSLVYEAFEKEEHVLQWFGPRAYPVTHFKHELRSGGPFEYVMTGPGGVEAPGSGTYDEVVPGERIVSTSAIDKPGGDGIWWQVRQVYTFTDTADGGTEFLLESFIEIDEGFPGRAGMEQGWTETLDRLGEFLER